MTRARAIAYGTLTVGILDITDAIVFFGLRNGVRPIRIFQSIAAGLLGRDSFSGGIKTAILGGFLHFFIAFAIVTTFVLVSERLPALRRHAIAYGLAYGVAVYLFMNLVVLPLSLVGKPTFVLPVVINGVLIHMFGIGLPSSLFARAAVR
jgi:uncharacterized membrane protein (GlpM family)